MSSFSLNILQFDCAGAVIAAIISSIAKSAMNRTGWIAAIHRRGEGAA